MATVEVALRATKGQGEDGVRLLASWRSSSACWRREKGDGMARVASVSVTGTAEIIDEDDGDRARGRERACLAASWCLGDATGER
jgi:hypothetical protein